jgi:hypothetical protein
MIAVLRIGEARIVRRSAIGTLPSAAPRLGVRRRATPAAVRIAGAASSATVVPTAAAIPMSATITALAARGGGLGMHIEAKRIERRRHRGQHGRTAAEQGTTKRDARGHGRPTPLPQDRQPAGQGLTKPYLPGTD